MKKRLRRRARGIVGDGELGNHRVAGGTEMRSRHTGGVVLRGLLEDSHVSVDVVVGVLHAVVGVLLHRVDGQTQCGAVMNSKRQQFKAFHASIACGSLGCTQPAVGESGMSFREQTTTFNCDDGGSWCRVCKDASSRVSSEHACTLQAGRSICRMRHGCAVGSGKIECITW
ncbi:hypothetical protein GOP47_0021290 [Adiantum capillus-veneris]|uniref:Uncharacterized protein n=1 Tax=Adiantum capillus-veneris TaxID=13818 RepID=A0A9D4UBB7_ADICA|nr:hypothetical protein GOP47_0021290 [Adiantum capillus-veneris]